MDDLCDICSARPATINDGMVGALLCDDPQCLDFAWDRAFSPFEGGASK